MTSRWPAKDGPPALCLGGHIKADNHAFCEPGFEIVGGSREAKIRFADKFCSCCKEEGLWLPANQVRAIPSHLEAKITNSQGGGLWSSNKDDPLLANFRVVNNRSRDSQKPVLIIFDGPAPKDERFELVPDKWCKDGHVYFKVTNGTLMPKAKRRAPASKQTPVCIGASDRSEATNPEESIGVTLAKSDSLDQSLEEHIDGLSPADDVSPADDISLFDDATDLTIDCGSSKPSGSLAHIAEHLLEDGESTTAEPSSPSSAGSQSSTCDLSSGGDANDVIDVCQLVQTLGDRSIVIDVLSARSGEARGELGNTSSSYPDLSLPPVAWPLHAQLMELAEPPLSPPLLPPLAGGAPSALPLQFAGGPMRHQKSPRAASSYASPRNPPLSLTQPIPTTRCLCPERATVALYVG